MQLMQNGKILFFEINCNKNRVNVKIFIKKEGIDNEKIQVL